jgi:hypothetical protein
MTDLAPDLLGLALRRSLNPDLGPIRARALARIVERDTLAQIFEIILSELAAARVVLTRAALADFCADVFQDRQRAYPGTPIINQAGYY